MEKETRDKIIAVLTEKGAVLPCPRCGKSKFATLEGYFNPTVQKDLNTYVVGGDSIPSTVVICTNCGFMSQHALGALGLLPDELKGGA